MAKRYYLKAPWRDGWDEVSVEEYCRAERDAGFRPRMPSDHPEYMRTPATGGFGGSGTRGKVEYD